MGERKLHQPGTCSARLVRQGVLLHLFPSASYRIVARLGPRVSQHSHQSSSLHTYPFSPFCADDLSSADPSWALVATPTFERGLFFSSRHSFAAITLLYILLTLWRAPVILSASTTSDSSHEIPLSTRRTTVTRYQEPPHSRLFAVVKLCAARHQITLLQTAIGRDVVIPCRSSSAQSHIR